MHLTPKSPATVRAGKDSSVVGLQSHYSREDDGIYIGSRLGLWSDSPEPDIVYYSKYSSYDGDGPAQMHRAAFCTEPSGNVFCSPFSQDEYLILGFTPDGDTLFHISEPYTRMNKTPEEIASEHMSYVLDTPGFDDSDRRRMSARWEPDPVRYAIRRLYLDLFCLGGSQNTIAVELLN